MCIWLLLNGPHSTFVLFRWTGNNSIDRTRGRLQRTESILESGTGRKMILYKISTEDSYMVSIP